MLNTLKTLRPAGPKGDAKLAHLEVLWTRAMVALEGAPATLNEAELDLLGRAVDEAERQIAGTPATGLPGIAVKLQLCAFHEEREAEKRPYFRVLVSALHDSQGVRP